eukprot:scpid26272/ scgid8588/ 
MCMVITLSIVVSLTLASSLILVWLCGTPQHFCLFMYAVCILEYCCYSLATNNLENWELMTGSRSVDSLCGRSCSGATSPAYGSGVALSEQRAFAPQDERVCRTRAPWAVVNVAVSEASRFCCASGLLIMGYNSSAVEEQLVALTPPEHFAATKSEEEKREGGQLAKPVGQEQAQRFGLGPFVQ